MSRDDIAAWLEHGGEPLSVDSAQEAATAGREAGWRVVELTLTEPTDKAALLRALQTAFALPEWFGHNWDALADVLRDVRPAEGEPGVLVVWSGADLVAPPVREIALEILTERCAQPGAPFRLAIAGG